jgi:hypothetical protein
MPPIRPNKLPKLNAKILAESKKTVLKEGYMIALGKKKLKSDLLESRREW